MKKNLPKLYLRDTNDFVVTFLQKYFKPFPEVEVSKGDILDIKADAIVSPANSFCDMGGGIDLVYRDKFGMDVEKFAKRIINARYYGELPIGAAISVLMKKQNYKYLILAPTMRLPMKIDNTLNPYFAFRAALLEARNLDVKSLLSPGLGTLTGDACPEMAARQMFVAYLNIFMNIGPTDLEQIFKQQNWMLRCSQDKRPTGA
jgi:O-acetyl-ADP-ribose deacetylase (regulator of RNase III)